MNMMSSNQNGWDRKYALKEADLHEKKLADDIGVGWRDLARALGFNESSIEIIEKEKNNCDKECCIRVLVSWLHKEGEDATAEKIFETLVKIERKSLAERFPRKPSDPSQNPEGVIHDLEGKLAKMRTRSKELEAEVDKTSARNKKLEDEVDKTSARNKKLEDENSRQSARIKELEDMIQKNKAMLETVAVAVQEMEKNPEQRREESLKRIKSQLKTDKLDVDNTNECLVSSVDGPNTAKDKEPKNDLLGYDATVPQQDEVHLLQSFEEQLLLCQGIFDALIKLIGEVSPQPKDNDFVWMSNLFFFTKALKNQEKLFSSKIKSLKSLKDNSNKDQSRELEKLVKRYKTHQQKVDELETLLSSLLFQRQGTKNQRSKPCSSKHSSQSQGLSDFQNIARPSISKPLCAHHMSTMDTEKEPEEGQFVSSQIRCQSDTSAAKKPKKQNDETRRPASYSSPGSDWKEIPSTKNNTLFE